MRLLDFNYIYSPYNNFDKIADVSSDLLWGDENIIESPLVSVLIITNSRPMLFREALNSVITQETVDYSWEIVVMDNNPDELDVLEIIEEFDEKRIRYYRNRQNIGHEGNINRGFELAKGDWVAMLHDDDLLVPNYLVLIQKYIQACKKWKKPLAYIQSRHILCSEKDTIVYKTKSSIESPFFIRPELWCESLLRGTGPTFVNSCGSLISRKLFIEIGGYNHDLYPIGDATLGLIFMNKGYSVYASERFLGYYRQGSNESINKKTVVEFIEADYQFREFLYAKNAVFSLWGKLFRMTQFRRSVDVKNMLLQKYSNAQNDKMILPSETEYICAYKKNKFMDVLLLLFKACFFAIYRPLRLFIRKP